MIRGEKGLSQVKFTTQGFGAPKPVTPNTKPDGSDDRVEMAVRK
jgi:outer membrane protein OmpA-like peptidoglycan-associated protein